MLMMPNASATSPRFRAPTMLVAVFWAALAMMGPVIQSEGAISGVCRRLGRRHADALVGILPQHVAQRPDRYAEDGGRVRPVAEAVAQRADAEVALDGIDSSADLQRRQIRRPPRCGGGR